MKKLKILLLEDLAEDVSLIRRVIRQGHLDFEDMHVDDEESFIKAVETYRPDVILSDHALPQFNSIEALRTCRKLGFTGPFILVTGTVTEEFAGMCLKMGFDDYVLKSNLSGLPAVIRKSLDVR
jgi:CheY-like chemotaxis protein